jgi:phosphoribosylamine-glycine ligase
MVTTSRSSSAIRYAETYWTGLSQNRPIGAKGLAWIAEAGDAGIVIFEDVRHGHVQDRLRAKGFNVVGGSAFDDRLENDRFFAQKTLFRLGLEIAKSWSFQDTAAFGHYGRDMFPWEKTAAVSD